MLYGRYVRNSENSKNSEKYGEARDTGNTENLGNAQMRYWQSAWKITVDMADTRKYGVRRTGKCDTS